MSFSTTRFLPHPFYGVSALESSRAESCGFRLDSSLVSNFDQTRFARRPIIEERMRYTGQAVFSRAQGGDGLIVKNEHHGNSDGGIADDECAVVASVAEGMLWGERR